MKTMTDAEQLNKEQPANDNKSHFDAMMVLSIVIFVIVCSTSVFLFFASKSLSESIEANKNEMSKYTSSIAEIKATNNNIRAELVLNNKASILSTIEKNQAQTYLAELQNIAKKYKLIFSGFSYANGKISTSAISIPETVLVTDDGVTKISTLVKDYREGTGLIFNLAPVLSISGYEQKRAFSLDFSVADLSPKIPPSK